MHTKSLFSTDTRRIVAFNSSLGIIKDDIEYVIDRPGCQNSGQRIPGILRN